MSFSLGPKGGVQDPHILKLICELTILVKKYGSKTTEVKDFIQTNKDIIFVDEHTKHMHTFEELADGLALLIGGIENKQEDDDDPANWWK